MTNYQKILSDLDATCGCTNAAAAAAVAIRELLAEREVRQTLTDARIMTREDIILMAQTAGACVFTYADGKWPDTIITNPDNLERFADLVAAAERKTCEVACTQAIEHAKKAEREACAKLCDLHGLGRTMVSPANLCAAAIRARSPQ